MSEAIPRLEREGERLYLVAGDGARYRVHDIAYGVPPASPHHAKRLPLCSHRATHRYFILSDGATRIHTFAQGEKRELAAELLERQLRSAGYGATERFDASKHAATVVVD